MKIIILEQPELGSFRYILWCDVPVNKRPYYADANKTSAYKLISAPDLAALRNGSVVEFAESMNFTTGTTLAAKQAQLVSRLTTVQNEVNATGNNSPLGRYGTIYDGATWMPGGLND